MTTNHCTACDVNWSPYQTLKGACPVCGSGTVRKQEPPSLDADARYKRAMDKRRAAEEQQRRRDNFDAFYADRAAAQLVAEAEAILRDAA